MNEEWKHFYKRTLVNQYTYHPPNDDQKAKYEKIRETALELAYVIAELCPTSSDSMAANERLRECVMWANSSIANYGERNCP